MVKYCNKCGHILREDSSYCEGCGIKISNDIQKIDFCKKCGTKIKENAQFCEECGEKILNIEDQREIKEQEIQKRLEYIDMEKQKKEMVIRQIKEKEEKRFERKKAVLNFFHKNFKKFAIFSIFIIVILIVLLVVNFIYQDSQAYLYEEWTKTYGLENCDEAANYISRTNDGGYIITGVTVDYDIKKSQAFLLKINDRGDQEWLKKFDAESVYDSDIHEVMQTNDDGFLIVGRDLIKTNSKGVFEWKTSSPGSTHSAVQLSDGTFFAVGSDIFKFDNNGNEIFFKDYKSDVDYFHEIIITEDNYLLVIGEKSDDLSLTKFDKDGNEIWNKTYGGKSSEAGYAIESCDENGYILTGSTSSYPSGSILPGRIWILKVDSNGNELWNTTFGDVCGEYVSQIINSYDTGYVIVGSITIPEYESNDKINCNSKNSKTWVFKIDSMGNLIWEKFFDMFGGTSIEYADINGYLVLAKTIGGDGSIDFAINKIYE